MHLWQRRSERAGRGRPADAADQAMSIFIAPPSIEELEKRLIKRNTDSLETIKTRINKTQKELNYQHLFDQVLINDDLETAKKEIENIISNFTEK